MTSLAPYVDKKVLVITHDGRTIVGLLQGFDQTTNVILSESIERIYSAEEGVEEAPLGLYIVRGDNIVLVGEVDVEEDAKIDYASIKADPIQEII